MAQTRHGQPDWGAPAHGQEFDRAAPQPAEAEVMGQRIVATIIDLVAANIAAFGVALILGLAWVAITGSFAGAGTALVYLVGGATVIGYFIVLEAMWGRTLGKAMLGLRVVNADDGGPIGWGASFGRNLLRIIDGLFFYLVGFIIAMTNPMRQRLGDLAAGTAVVED